MDNITNYSTILHEENFINRTEIRNTIMSYYDNFNVDNTNLFEVFSVYGFGGMGKTYLVKYLKNEILKTFPPDSVIHISFEIKNNLQKETSIIKLRKQFKFACPIFDYAFLLYWEMEHIERLDDDFLMLLKNNIIESFANMGITAINGLFQKIIPSFSDIQNLINKTYTKINQIPVRVQISEIIQMDSRELLQKLQYFLALDIKKHMYSKQTNYIFIFDSYQQSIPYSPTAEWLFDFINEMRKGLFIITSREKLLWKPKRYEIHEYMLNTYPIEETRTYLNKIISSDRIDIIDTIIESTQCIPIYVSLASDLYKNEKNISSEELIERIKFSDKESLVSHFIDHLKKEWQDIIVYLSIIKIFNENIFCYFIEKLNLQCSILDFQEITQVSLLNYTEQSNDLVKIHDIFCKNAIAVLDTYVISKIFDTYLTYLAKREVQLNLINKNLNSIIALFSNVINLCIDYNKKIKLSKEMSENIIDLFLMISDTKILLPIPKPSDNYAIEINDILYFMDAILYEKENTNQTVEKLKKVRKAANLGKHYKSYNIFFKYAEALTGRYEPFKNYLETIDRSFNEKERCEWYYLKTKIYLSDYYMMEGEFIKSLEYLRMLENSLSLEIYNTDNYFLVKRSIGHIYRFNYDFATAIWYYDELLKYYNDNKSICVYLLVNLCETKCYVDPQYVVKNFSEILTYVEQFHNLKNKAKLFYSRGIAYTLLHKYAEAISDIEISIKINEMDGYSSGILFAYEAKAFWEYGKYGMISAETVSKIEQLIKENKVYDFLKYPIYLITNKVADLKPIKWLNYKVTKDNCENFINRLHPK